MVGDGPSGVKPQGPGLPIDDENEEKFSSHGISASRVLQLLEGGRAVVPNRRGRRAMYLFVGRDSGGACIAVPIEPTHETGLWRPITAWPCKQSEERLLE